VFQGALSELASLTVFRVPDAIDLQRSEDVRLMWRHHGQLRVAVPRESALAAALVRLPGCVEEPQGLTLSALYQGTVHAC